ncbi:MAG: hypothetical protein ACJAS4_001065 [Bacteriovoracaceae bacterium]
MVDANRLDALLNEYKGNLFEFLFCHSLARITGLEGEFLNKLTPSMSTILEQQESFLRNYFPYLLTELPELASKTALEVKSSLNLKKVEEILLIGKVAGASNDKRFDEADIIIRDAGQTIPISIKISKNHSYVNTKSGGVRTFFVKYFTSFDTEKIQQDFNRFCDYEYEALAIKMHHMQEIPYTEGFKNWEAVGEEVLPGQLSEDLRVPLLDYYHKVNEQISNYLQTFLKENKKGFLKDLAPLIGFSNKEVIQVTSFYQLKNEKFINTKISILPYIKNLKFEEFIVRRNNLDVKLNKLSLQIRIKPMNKFTSKAFKINCAISYNLN